VCTTRWYTPRTSGKPYDGGRRDTGPRPRCCRAAGPARSRSFRSSDPAPTSYTARAPRGNRRGDGGRLCLRRPLRGIRPPWPTHPAEWHARRVTEGRTEAESLGGPIAKAEAITGGRLDQAAQPSSREEHELTGAQRISRGDGAKGGKFTTVALIAANEQ